MRTLISIITLTFFIFLTSFNNGRKVNLIYIKNAIANAKSIRLIKVYGYTETYMLYGFGRSVDTFHIKSKREKFINLKTVAKISNGDDAEFGGKWPSIGQNVLMLIDSANILNLLAFKVKDDYRFWDPNSMPFANSIFMIPKENSFKQLPNCIQILDPKSDMRSCADGCLVSANSIKLKN